MNPTEIFLEIGKTLTIVHYVPGRIRLRFSLKSVPLIKQFSKQMSVSDASVEQLIDLLDGVNKVKVNRIVGSATIEYNPDLWPKLVWENLCNGESNPELVQKVSNAVARLSS